jgi:hypothetical protein
MHQTVCILLFVPAYIRCVTDPYCAAGTVDRYLTKYAQVSFDK